MTATGKGREQAAAARSDNSTSAVGLTQPSKEQQIHASIVRGRPCRPQTIVSGPWRFAIIQLFERMATQLQAGRNRP
jgi:hypothetical protein